MSLPTFSSQFVFCLFFFYLVQVLYYTTVYHCLWFPST
uniref:Uncharacterized protein n=1 Tax=Anguilla anguilla TaxID=7936 RepID=A0A0E9VXB2_ANGAN